MYVGPFVREITLSSVHTCIAAPANTQVTTHGPRVCFIVRLCKHTQGAIETDKFNKFKTKQIENLCASLRATSGGIQLYPGIEDIDPT